MTHRGNAIFMFLTVASLGCTASPENPALLEISEIQPTSRTLRADVRIEAASAVLAAGTSRDGRIVVALADRVAEVVGGTLETRSLYVAGEDPASTGLVHRVEQKSERGVYFATDRGLFALDALYLVYEPLTLAMGAVRAAYEVPTGKPLSGLWLGADAGLFLKTDDEVAKLELTGFSGAVSAVVGSADGRSALAVIAGELTLISVGSDGSLVSETPPLGDARFSSLAAGASALYAGSDRGLFRFDPAGDPAWVQLTFASPGSEPQVVLALAAGSDGTVFARTPSALVSVLGETLEAYPAAALAEDATAVLAADDQGDVWLSEGNTLIRATPAAASEPTTFQDDLLPWITDHCSRCHVNNTADFSDPAVFAQRAEQAFARVRSGDMPRCDGGIVCADNRLTEAEYELLSRWIRDGKMP